jgi:hypothetical protein
MGKYMQHYLRVQKMTKTIIAKSLRLKIHKETLKNVMVTRKCNTFIGMCRLLLTFKGNQNLLKQQCVLRSLLNVNTSTSVAAGWNVKFIFCCMEKTRETLHPVKWSVVLQKIVDIPTSIILITVTLDEAFKCGDGAKFWGYIETNAGPRCV